MTFSKSQRLGVIVLGYGAAVAAGCLAVWGKNLGISPADMTASSGMYAFGDLLCFLGVASVVSVLPTIVLFSFISSASRWWPLSAKLNLLVAGSGLFCSIILLVPHRLASPAVQSMQMVAVLRVLAAPLCFLAFAPGLFLGEMASRRKVLLACTIEAAAVFLFVLRLAVLR